MIVENGRSGSHLNLHRRAISSDLMKVRMGVMHEEGIGDRDEDGDVSGWVTRPAC
jgi:hypothetical protein